MRRGSILIGAIGFALLLAAGCGGSDEAAGWTRAEATIDGATYPVDDVSMEMEFGEGGYYNISGTSRDDEEDCVPGLGSGMMLYGPLPASATSTADLIGARMPLEFSGDGDDANLCFVGTEGLLGASDAWVTIRSVLDDRVEFEMSGEFVLYDGEGGSSPRPRRAAVIGTAQITNIW